MTLLVVSVQRFTPQDNQGCCMCGIGHIMSKRGTCQDPQCVLCGLDEHMDKYIRMTICEWQPYCHPLKNFRDCRDKSEGDIEYYMYHCRHCAPIREIRDQRLRLLYQRINPEAEIAHCRETVKFGTHCMPCEGESYEEDTRTVMCHDGRSVERSVASSEMVAVSSLSYQCPVGNAMVSSHEPSSALRKAVEKLNTDPEARIDEFLATWG
uniref:Uncharacterized protein n=1 Tax=Scophthalmus maximus TaxID=52904 RepID=A0A8D3DDR2_SCOMX